MRRWLFRILVCLILGAATTVVVAWVCAWRQDVTSTPRGGVTRTISPQSGVLPQPAGLVVGSEIAAGYQAHRLQMPPVGNALDDFVHYALIAKPNLAAAFGEYVRRCGMVSDFRLLNERYPDRWSEGIQRASRIVELQQIASELDQMMRAAEDAEDVGALPEKSASGERGISALTVEVGWPLYALEGALVYESENPDGTPHGLIRLQGSEKYLPYVVRWREFVINSTLFALLIMLVLWHRNMYRALRRVNRGCCPQCGYNLRGNVAEGCPECGWRRE